MKKIFSILLLLSVVTVSSCKKDNEIVPKAEKSIKTFDKTNVGSWD